MPEADRHLPRDINNDSAPVFFDWNEWQEWALHSESPGRQLALLSQDERFSCFPELAALPGVPQDPEWHPEGDVLIHTLHVCDAAARIALREQLDAFDRTVLLFSALCHDLGKATTTEFVNGRWHAYEHCAAGVPLTRSFLFSIGCPEEVIEVVEPLVAEHLIHAQPKPTFRSVRRLYRRLGKATIGQLVRLIEADLKGRPPLPGDLPASLAQLQELVEQQPVELDRPAPIILGRHIIALGYQPGVWFGKVLETCFEAQMSGMFDSEVDGIEFLQQTIRIHQPDSHCGET